MTEQQPAPSDFNQQVIAEFRTNGGKVAGMFEGAPLILLTTTGARSGRPHTNPAVYLRDGARVLVFGSNAGRPKNPDWYHNLRSEPRCTVEIGTVDGRVESYAARAEPIEGEERDRLYQIQCELDPAFTAYQAGTSRTIPVIALHRVDLSAGAEQSRRNHAIAQFLVRVHDELRGELAAIRKDVDDYFADQHLTEKALPSGSRRPRLDRKLAQHCLLFCDALHGHHTNEDGAFADFEKQFPELAPALDRLRREHRLVAQAVTDLQALLTRLTPGTDPLEADSLETAAPETTPPEPLTVGTTTPEPHTFGTTTPQRDTPRTTTPEPRAFGTTAQPGTHGTTSPETRAFGTTTIGSRASETNAADAETFRAELERLASSLEEHFAYEEAQLLPALTRTLKIN